MVTTGTLYEIATGTKVLPRHYERMSVSGICQICESAEAEYSCDHCGRNVCRLHYERSVGACVECASSLDEGTRPPDVDVDVDAEGEEDVSGTDRRQ